MRQRMILMLILVGLLFGGIFGFQMFKAHKMQEFMKASGMPPQTVAAMKIKYETWQPQMDFVGTIKSVQGVDVTTEVAGMIVEIPLDSGSTVKKGDVLVKLNADTDTAHLHVLEAAVELAQTTYERDKAQYSIGAVSKAALDADIADLKEKKAQLEAQTSLVEKKTIRAPFSGKAGIVIVNEGQYINPGDKIVPLQDLTSVLVDFFVPQQAIDRIKVGQPISLKVDGYPGQTFKGKITSIDPAVKPDTRTIKVQATLPNPAQKLLPEMYAFLEVETGKPKKYLTLPQTAISHNAYGDVVYIIQTKENHGKTELKALQTFVTLGEARGDQVAILKGLKEDDLVVTAGQLKLKNGTPVLIDNTIKLPNDPAPTPPNEIN